MATWAFDLKAVAAVLEATAQGAAEPAMQIPTPRNPRPRGADLLETPS